MLRPATTAAAAAARRVQENPWYGHRSIPDLSIDGLVRRRLGESPRGRRRQDSLAGASFFIQLSNNASFYLGVRAMRLKIILELSQEIFNLRVIDSTNYWTVANIVLGNDHIHFPLL